jgi:hypothetical protein
MMIEFKCFTYVHRYCLQYHETVDFTNYLDLLDAYFRAIYNSVENAGRNFLKEILLI